MLCIDEYYDALAKTVALVPWQPPHTRTADAFKTSQRIESSAHALHAHLGLRGGLLLLGHLPIRRCSFEKSRRWGANIKAPTSKWEFGRCDEEWCMIEGPWRTRVLCIMQRCSGEQQRRSLEAHSVRSRVRRQEERSSRRRRGGSG